MRVMFKGQYPSNKNIPEDDKNRCYELGEVKGQVRLTEKGVDILITDYRLGEDIRKILSERDNKRVKS